jgi:hypothetical protein
MADFISGQDLVARGAEGTGAAVVLDNRPTIQSLARLGGRMDNLYKTQEMLKLKLAAAKAEQAKPPKQPNLNPYATGGVIGENLGAIGNTFMQGISAIKGARYNQKVAANDITGANQEAADAASVLATLNPVVGNTDKVVKSFLDEHKEYYDLTPQKTQEIIARFPSINQQELSKITDPAEQEKYIMGKYNQFLQTDANKILRDATVYDPRSYDYNKIFTVINKNLATRTEDIKKAGGTGYTNISSELFKIIPGKPIELNYNKALSAIDQLPKAREQVEVLQTLAVNKAKETDIYKNLAEDKKESALDFIKENTAKKYADKVFAIGLPLEQKRDFESTRAKAEAEAKGKMAAENLPPTSEGPMTFNVNRDIAIEQPKLDANGNPIMRTVNGKQFVDKEKVRTENFDYPVQSVGKTVVVKDFPLSNNQPFVFLSKQTPEDLLAIKARAYSPLGTKESVSYVSGLGSTASSATKVVGGLPMFKRAVQDLKDTNKTWYPGDFVPEYMLLAKKGREGKAVDYLEESDYFKPTGIVASPEITSPSQLGGTITQSTMQLFYPDKLSQQKVFEALAEGKRQRSGDIFSKGKK